MTRLSVLILGMLVHVSLHADWPHWRGPERNDISAESSAWKEGVPWIKSELWKASVGEGSSAPVVIGRRVYFTGWTNDQDKLTCLDLDTGTEVWHATYPSPRYGRFALGDQGLYSGACSTPEYDPATGLLFTLGTDGDLIAWDTKQAGKKTWALNLYDRYGAERRPEVAKRKKTRRDYGYVSSPLVIENQLIVEVGGKQGNLVAFDTRSGRPIPKAYVKVYAELQDGRTSFYKDGYTDLRGRFDYSSLSTNELDFVKRFSILVLDEQRGGLVQEARAPKQ